MWKGINNPQKSTECNVSEYELVEVVKDCKLETLRERRPPWPRQIITPILPTVKMLSLGGERLTRHPPPPKKKKKKKRRRKKKEFLIITCTTIWVCHHYYGVFCSFTHLRIPRSPPKFNQFCIVLPRTPP